MRLTTLMLTSTLVFLPFSLQATERVTYGVSEKALLADLDLELPAKLDTGAVTASLSAQNIQIIERPDGDWVRFNLAFEDERQGQVFERPVIRIAQIKRRAADIPDDESQSYTERPVIAMPVCLGNTRHEIEVNLTDRTGFDYPMLIGSTALQQFEAVVDPSLTYSAGSPNC
ncbi:MAG: ATP-dependent zinc protease [Gammaproteobacteria bacterium HGW-Gammaproteobacteria-6]|nr:MAG: ATP-dependent zinc protease [Gammaproteobacteria bacterium HGW-Gammaproteobacteria-6]